MRRDRDAQQRLWLSLGYGGKGSPKTIWRYWSKPRAQPVAQAREVEPLHRSNPQRYVTPVQPPGPNGSSGPPRAGQLRGIAVVSR